jgi:hypothetical protein
MALPCTALALDIETTGCWIGVHKIVAIGAALFKLTPQREVVELESRVFKFKVNYPTDFDPVTLKDFWHVEDRLTLLNTLQQDALEEAEAIAKFYEFYTSVCLRYPGFYLLSDNVSMDISFINLSIATKLNKPPLIYRPAPPSTTTTDSSSTVTTQPAFTHPHFPVDANSFACGLIGLHFPPYRKEAGTRWACPADFLKFHKPCLYCPFKKTHSPDDDAKFVVWQFLQCISILWDQEQAALEGKVQDAALDVSSESSGATYSTPTTTTTLNARLFSHSPPRESTLHHAMCSKPIAIHCEERESNRKREKRSVSDPVILRPSNMGLSRSPPGSSHSTSFTSASYSILPSASSGGDDSSNEHSPGRKRNNRNNSRNCKKWNRKFEGRHENSTTCSAQRKERTIVVV